MSKASGVEQLSVVLNYTDRLSGKAPRTIKSLRAIGAEGKKTLAVIQKLNKALGGGGAAAGRGVKLPSLSGAYAVELKRGLEIETKQARLLREQTRSREAELRLKQVGVRLALSEARAAQSLERSQRASLPRSRRYIPGDWMRDSDRPPRWRDEVDDGRRRLNGRGRAAADDRIERFGRGAGRARDAVYNFQESYTLARDNIQRYTDPASDLMRARARLGTLGLDSNESARANEAIRKTVDAVPGARLNEVTQAFAELYEVFASVEDTASKLPRAAKYSFALKTLHGDRYSPEQLITQTKAAYKFVDLIGLTKPDASGRVDHAKVDDYHDRLMQAMSATGGDVDPREMLQLAKIGGTSLMGMSREGLAHMASLASDVTGSRAGNMQRAMFQTFVGGKIFDKNINALAEFGMVDRSKVRKGRAGQVNLLPGGIKYADTIATDPLIFIDKLAEGMRAKGVNTDSEKEVVNATARLAPNTHTQNMLAQMIIRRAEITRFDELIKQAEALDKMFARANASPLGKIEDAKSKAENWRATTGEPMLEAGGSLSEYFTRMFSGLQSFSEGSPTISAALAGITSLGGASLSAGEGVGTLAGLLRELKSGGGGGGGIAGTGVDVGDAVIGTGWGLSRLGKGALGLAGAYGASAAAPVTAAILSVIAGGVGLYTRHKAGEAGEASDRANADLFESTTKLREQSGGRLPEGVAKSLGTTTFIQLDRDGDLTSKLAPGLKGAYQRAYDPSDYQGWLRSFDPDRAVELFRKRAPGLQYPEMMKPFLQDVNRRWLGGEIRPETKDNMLKAAQSAFPESFKQAGAEIAQLSDQLPPLTGAMSGLFEPTQRLTGGLTSAETAALGFAARVNSLDLTVPFPVYQPFTVPPLGAPKAPGSAIGSVVQSDGLVSAHRGNVIFPASLSRRAPGDWLDSADALREGAGDPDYTAFASRAAGGGGQVIHFAPVIHIPPGHPAAQDTGELLAFLEREMGRLAQELAATRADLDDPRYLYNVVGHEVRSQNGRA